MKRSILIIVMFVLSAFHVDAIGLSEPIMFERLDVRLQEKLYSIYRDDDFLQSIKSENFLNFLAEQNFEVSKNLKPEIDLEASVDFESLKELDDKIEISVEKESKGGSTKLDDKRKKKIASKRISVKDLDLIPNEENPKNEKNFSLDDSKFDYVNVETESKNEEEEFLKINPIKLGDRNEWGVRYNSDNPIYLFNNKKIFFNDKLKSLFVKFDLHSKELLEHILIKFLQTDLRFNLMKQEKLICADFNYFEDKYFVRCDLFYENLKLWNSYFEFIMNDDGNLLSVESNIWRVEDKFDVEEVFLLSPEKLIIEARFKEYLTKNVQIEKVLYQDESDVIVFGYLLNAFSEQDLLISSLLIDSFYNLVEVSLDTVLQFADSETENDVTVSENEDIESSAVESSVVDNPAVESENEKIDPIEKEVEVVDDKGDLVDADGNASVWLTEDELLVENEPSVRKFLPVDEKLQKVSVEDQVDRQQEEEFDLELTLDLEDYEMYFMGKILLNEQEIYMPLRNLTVVIEGMEYKTDDFGMIKAKVRSSEIMSLGMNQTALLQSDRLQFLDSSLDFSLFMAEQEQLYYLSDDLIKTNSWYGFNLGLDYFAKLGFSTDTQLAVQLNSDVVNKCMSFFDSALSQIFLGAGDVACNNLNQALALDIILHELTHFVMVNIRQIPSVKGSEALALQEAIADYFSATVRNDSTIGKNYLPEPRNLENELTMLTFGDDDYQNSLIFSGALWDLRTELTKHEADRLIFSSLYAGRRTFENFMIQLLIEDDDNNNVFDGTPNDKIILDTFFRRGIGSGYDGFIFSILEDEDFFQEDVKLFVSVTFDIDQGVLNLGSASLVPFVHNESIAITVETDSNNGTDIYMRYVDIGGGAGFYNQATDSTLSSVASSALLDNAVGVGMFATTESNLIDIHAGFDDDGIDDTALSTNSHKIATVENSFEAPASLSVKFRTKLDSALPIGTYTSNLTVRVVATF